MPRTTAPDPALVERIRDLLARPGTQTAPGRGAAREPGWVPGRPGDAAAPQVPTAHRVLTAPPGLTSPPVLTAPAVLTAPRVLTAPAFLRKARLRVSRRALAAMAVLVAVAAAVFAVRVMVAVRQGEPVAVSPDRSGLLARSVPPGFTAIAAPTTQATGVSTPADAPVASASSAGGGGPPTVLVHVVGEVASPGVVTLGAGSRVADAVAKAGGALPTADLKRVNLARVVVDGEQIHVPAPGEPLLPGSDGAGSASGLAGSGGTARDSHQLINLNTADVAALDTLPGVGPVLAQRIVQWRQEHGRFTSVEELNEVSGIGDKLFAQLRARVTV